MEVKDIFLFSALPEEKFIFVANPFFANLAWYLGWFSVRTLVLEKRSAPK